MKVIIDLSTLEVTTDTDTPYAESIRRIYEDVSIQLLRKLVESEKKEVQLIVIVEEVA